MNMEVNEGYNNWANNYDSDENKTRDLEAKALRTNLSPYSFASCLEIGCGTGKNTSWLVNKADHVLAVDFSPGMLMKAREKIQAKNVVLQQADINLPWDFTDKKFDLVCFSLVLEHTENLDFIFFELQKVTAIGGRVYIGELHPYKQYSGSQARFETKEGFQKITSFKHHISDYIQSAKKYNFGIEDINEYFDEGSENKIPRILTLRLKNGSGSK
ncbi:MAG TPA: class I SAM-dependent methyltransferase [Flavisolibacter sp.]|nr:class I SAM-dependent methyltransferase [Flavisolibacter sp.]